jgi:hypothetical protein
MLEAKAFGSVVEEEEIDPQLTFFSDEAWFHLQRYINTENNRYWSSQNPHLTHEVLLHLVKVGVLCIVKRKDCCTCVLTKQLRKLCTGHSRAILSRVKEKKTLPGFNQGSATALTASISMQTLSDVFGDKIISSGIWPARSPEFSSGTG